MSNPNKNNQYTITGINPLKNFSGNEEKNTYTLNELQKFYFAHHPEKETCSLDDIKNLFHEIGSTIELATEN